LETYQPFAVYYILMIYRSPAVYSFYLAVRASGNPSSRFGVPNSCVLQQIGTQPCEAMAKMVNGADTRGAYLARK